MCRARSSVLMRLVLLVGSLALAFAAASPVPAGAAGTGDDYPLDLKTLSIDQDIIDPWGFSSRHCTSFAAWRLNQQAGRTSAPWAFTHTMTGPNGREVQFGNAIDWRAAAITGGWRHDATPALGAVAWWGSGLSPWGHVAIVTAINADGSVNVEEYNWDNSASFHTRNNVHAEEYLHLADQPGDSIGPGGPAAIATAATPPPSTGTATGPAPAKASGSPAPNPPTSSATSLGAHPGSVQVGTTTSATSAHSSARGLSLRVRAIKRASRLWLDVNPDWPGGSYTVLIQRRRGLTWKLVATAQTRGRRDTLSKNLPRGVYRFVASSPRTASTTSRTLRLER